MKKLTQTDIARRDDLTEKLTEVLGHIEDRLRTLEPAIAEINAMVSDYNELVHDANAFAEDIASSIDAYVDERSDRWRDSDTGTAYQDWYNAWQEISFEEIDDYEVPEAPEVDTTLMQEAPTEPEG